MRIVTYILITLISLNAIGQFSVKDENQYLKLINKGNDKRLHKQNFHTAELLVDSLFIYEKTPLSSQYLLELAQSYSITKNWEMVIFSIIRQRAVFPNDSLNTKGVNLLTKAANHLNLTSQEVETVINKTDKEKYNGHQAGWHNAITTCFYLKTNKLDIQILHLYNLYQTKFDNNNMVLREINTLIQFDIPIKYRPEMINREAENEDDWIKNLNKKQRMVFLRKKVNYQKKNMGNQQVRVTLKEFKSQGMNIRQSIFYCWKWIF